MHRFPKVKHPLDLTLVDSTNATLGSPFTRSRRADLSAIGLPSCDLNDLDVLFTEAEVRDVVMSMPSDKAPGPGGSLGFSRRWLGISSRETS